MNKDIYEIYKYIQDQYCSYCDVVEEGCPDCSVKFIMSKLINLEIGNDEENNEGCHICAPKKGRRQEVFYDDGRGGLKVAEYCPNCGRKISG